MGWNIDLDVNTLKFPSREAAEEVVSWGDENGFCWNPVEDVDGWLVDFDDQDAMEHMDILWDENIQEIILRHGAVGDICFSSSEGDDAGEEWGYRFTKNGEVKKLSSERKWIEDE
jgi:hypothetical protein